MSKDPSGNPSVGFPLFVSTLALIVAFGALMAVAFKLDGGGSASAQTTDSEEAAPASAVEAVSLTIKSDEEHGKKGSDGNWHDAYLPASFTVQPGATVRVSVRNYDDSGHTFTAAGLGMNQMIAPGSEAEPSTTTFTFKAPSKSGRYEWHCMVPCDPWAMAHVGFMKGFVTVA